MLPPASVAVYSTVLMPSGKIEPEARPLVSVTTTFGQSSVAVGIEYVTTAVHLSTSVPTAILAGQLITGFVSSEIVTFTLQVDTLPLASVAVTVIIVWPPLMLPNAEPGTGFCVRVTVPQLSASSSIPVNTSGTTSLQLATTIGAGQVNVGAMLSSTVTVATQVDTLPAASVTVKVTLLSPTLLQSNVLSLMTVDCTPQLSEEPPSTSDATMFTLPVTSSSTVMSSHTAVGVCRSVTVIVNAQVTMLPPASVAVYSTVLIPSGKIEPEARPAVCVTTTPGQSSIAVGIE